MRNRGHMIAVLFCFFFLAAAPVAQANIEIISSDYKQLSPDHGLPGAIVNISGVHTTNPPGIVLEGQLYWDSIDFVNKVGQAFWTDPDGRFETFFDVPQNATPGPHELFIVFPAPSILTLTFTVDEPQTVREDAYISPDNTDQAALPSTGLNIPFLILSAAVLPGAFLLARIYYRKRA